jgi:hypothetical protein
MAESFLQMVNLIMASRSEGRFGAAWMHRNVAYARVIAGLTGEKKLNPAYLVEVMDLTLMASVAKAAL